MSGQFSGEHGPNFAKLGDDIEPSSLITNFVSGFRYLAPFRKTGGSNVSGVEK